MFQWVRFFLWKREAAKNLVTLLSTINTALCHLLAFPSQHSPPHFGTLLPRRLLFSCTRGILLRNPLLIIDIISVLGSHNIIVSGFPVYSSTHCRWKFTILWNFGYYTFSRVWGQILCHLPAVKDICCC